MTNLEKHGLEELARFNQEGNRVRFEFGSARLVVTVLADNLLRVHYAPTGQFAARRSWAVAKADSEYAGVALSISEELETIELATAQLRLRVRRADGGVELTTADGQLLLQDVPQQGPRFGSDGNLVSLKVLPTNEYYYGFGERTSLLDKRGKRYTCWNTDPFERNGDHGPGTDRMYQSIPFFMALRPQVGGYGLFFNNTFKTVFDVGHTQPEQLSMEAEGGELDYYLIYGPDPARIVETYTDLTGRMPLPPRWALGYHQCRWSYYPEAQVREIAAGFRSRQIPADVIHLDIDYMDGFRVFTWDKNHFPDPAKLLRDLRKDGFKVVTIIDPGVKYDPDNGYQVYDQGAEHDYFIRKADGEVFHGYVWPDDSVFPDFANAEVGRWWGDLHKGLLETGVQGIWNDMNEPAMSSKPFGEDGMLMEMPTDTPQGVIGGKTSKGEPTTHAEVHNMYAWLEDKATYEGLRRLQPDVRPFLLTRAGFAGIQRWSAVWTGDNTALWEHLEMSIPQLSNLGLSGVSFAGADIGGFGGPSSGELWARWIELGAFYPFSRGHSITGAPQKEPWMWGDPTEGIVRKYLELRYRMLPYLYTLFEESSRSGAPILRPLIYQFYDDPAVLELHDQVMVGDGLLLAPVYRPGVEYRHVYLPQGLWYDFWSGAPMQDSHLLAHAPLETMPMYVRGGTVLPLGPAMQYSDEHPIDRLTLEVYLDRKGTAQGRLYEDDGVSFAYERGESCTTTYSLTTDEAGLVHLAARRQGQYQPAPRSVEINLHSRAGLKSLVLSHDNGDWETTL